MGLVVNQFWQRLFVFIYFDVIIPQRLKQKFKAAELFFSHANEVTICDLVQKLILVTLKYLILK